MAGADGRKRLLERVMQLAQQRLQVDAARDQENAARGWLVDNRQQQMLEPHDIVTTLGGRAKCPLNRLERLGANGTGGLLMCSPGPSLVAGCLGLRLHCHQERELVLFGKILTVFNFVSATIMCIDASQAQSRSMPLAMIMGFPARLVEHRLQDPDHEILCGVVVVV